MVPKDKKLISYLDYGLYCSLSKEVHLDSIPTMHYIRKTCETTANELLYNIPLLWCYCTLTQIDLTWNYSMQNSMVQWNSRWYRLIFLFLYFKSKIQLTSDICFSNTASHLYCVFLTTKKKLCRAKKKVFKMFPWTTPFLFSVSSYTL